MTKGVTTGDDVEYLHQLLPDWKLKITEASCPVLPFAGVYQHMQQSWQERAPTHALGFPVRYFQFRLSDAQMSGIV